MIILYSSATKKEGLPYEDRKSKREPDPLHPDQRGSGQQGAEDQRAGLRNGKGQEPVPGYDATGEF